MSLAAVPLLAFGFESLPMLGWLAAASAPLIIHLWNKRKYREMSWAAIDFLLAAMRKNARRIQLQQWLLLAVRTVIILLVVLAVAGPYWERLGLTFVAGQRTHKMLVIDGSFSMGYRPTDSSLFARAKELAARIVDESPQGDGFTLVLMGARPRVVVGTPAFEPRDFIEEIEALTFPHAGGDLPATIGRVEEILQRVQRENPGLEQHQVFFLTDLGRNSWVPDLKGGEAASQFQEHIDQVARLASLVVIDLGQPGSENLAITELKTQQSFATVGRDVLLEAQVRNFGNQAYARQLVELLVDDSRVQQEYVDVEAGGQATLSFSHRFETPGHHVVRLRLGADLLDVDNQRWLSLPVAPHMRVLCVSGKQGSTRYLTSALAPDRSERSLVRAEVVSESALIELDLNQFDCIFLSNVGQFTTGEAKLLENYLKQGGGLVFFLGDRVLAERYNRVLADPREPGAQVLPVRLGPLVAENHYQFDPLDYKHPIISPFRGRERAGLLTTQVSRYYRLILPEDSSQTRVALGFAGGDPAIVEAPVYRGRVIVVATAASLDSVDPVTKHPWTTMPAWHSFLPIVQEILAAAVGSQIDQFNATVGETLGGALAGTATSVSLTMRSPSGAEQPVQVATTADDARWTFDATELSGIYTAESDESASTVRPYAVNVDTTESDLRKADPSELPSALIVQTDWQDLDQRPTSQISRRTGLHKWLLYGALLLMLVETCLAWAFGRGAFSYAKPSAR